MILGPVDHVVGNTLITSNQITRLGKMEKRINTSLVMPRTQREVDFRRRRKSEDPTSDVEMGQWQYIGR